MTTGSIFLFLHPHDAFSLTPYTHFMTPQVFTGLVFGLIEGLLLGLLPLITGMKKNQPGLAFGGFFGCIVAGTAGGFILGIPAAALFWWLIKKAETNRKISKIEVS
jgi:hypothetical protein